MAQAAHLEAPRIQIMQVRFCPNLTGHDDDDADDTLHLSGKAVELDEENGSSIEEPSRQTGSKCRSRAAIQDKDDDLIKDSKFQKRLDAAVDKEERVLAITAESASAGRRRAIPEVADELKKMLSDVVDTHIHREAAS